MVIAEKPKTASKLSNAQTNEVTNSSFMVQAP